MNARERLVRFLRASGVGLLASALDLGVLTLLVRGQGWSAAQANVPALLAGALVQFWGARQLVFAAAQGPLGRQLRRFALAELGTLALNALAFQLLTMLTPLPCELARIVGTFAVFAGFSLPAWTRVFRAEPAAPGMP